MIRLPFPTRGPLVPTNEANLLQRVTFITQTGLYGAFLGTAFSRGL